MPSGEDLCGLLEGGECSPLLEKARRSDNEENDVLLQPKPSDWRAPSVILAFELLESIAYSGIATNLVIYLTTILHESNSEAATHTASWTGTCYLMPLLGAFVNDSVLGSYKTTFISASIYVLGMVAVTISAALPPSVTAQPPIFYFALFLVALGSGWMKSSLMPLGAAQFDDDNPLDVERKGAFFSNFYMCLVVGSLISGTVIIWIQENIGWVVGYGAAASCVALGLAGFLVATPLFRKQAPYGSPLVSIVQVVIASFRKIWLKVPSDGSLLYEGCEETKREERLAHTMHFSFLDKAATQDAADQLGGRPDPWRLCTVTQVEKLKLLLGTSTIWLMSAVFTTAYGQFSTTILEQTNAMDTTVLSFRLPAASLSAVEVVFVMLSAALHDNLLAPLAARCTGNPRGLTLLQRMGVGRALMVLAMASAAITESRRLDAALHGERVNVAWQLPTCVLVGGADAMGFIAQLEFFYEEVPEGMKGMGTALYLMSIAAGNYLCSLMVRAVQAATARGGRKGWIPEDLDEGRLDCFFWGLCGLSALNLVAHVVVSRKYRPRKPTVYQEEI